MSDYAGFTFLFSNYRFGKRLNIQYQLRIIKKTEAILLEARLLGFIHAII